MAGSADQARRGAACLSVDGTPGCRKTRMAVLAPIESSDGSLVRSISGALAAAGVVPATAGVASGLGSAGLSGPVAAGLSGCAFSLAVSRLRRDQRERKFS